jgi:hypothetical protein
VVGGGGHVASLSTRRRGWKVLGVVIVVVWWWVLSPLCLPFRVVGLGANVPCWDAEGLSRVLSPLCLRFRVVRYGRRGLVEVENPSITTKRERRAGGGSRTLVFRVSAWWRAGGSRRFPRHVGMREEGGG